MPKLHLTHATTDLGTEMADILPPMDVGDFARRMVTIKNAGDNAFADGKIETGPSDSGPWFAETPPAELATLAAGASCRWSNVSAARYVRVQAKTGSNTTDVQVWLDALPI